MEVYVESQSQFHPRQFDRCRVEVGKTETRRPKWSCAAHGCACGYPVARTDWTVMGHPELTVEVTQDIDGNLIIRVM
jgi:hypothetical protein